MAWITPKTNWTRVDYFNATDYNRIKNNLSHLSTMVNPPVELTSMGADRTVRELVYSGNLNIFEQNAVRICEAVGETYDGYPMFYENGRMITWTELNQLESLMLNLYNMLSGEGVYAIDLTGVYAVSNNQKAKGRVL